MKKEKEAMDKARLAVHEYYWAQTDDNILVRCRKQKQLVEELQRAEKAYKEAYAKSVRDTFLQLGECYEAV